MLNMGGNGRNFAEAGRLPILTCGKNIKNSVSVHTGPCTACWAVNNNHNTKSLCGVVGWVDLSVRM